MLPARRQLEDAVRSNNRPPAWEGNPCQQGLFRSPPVHLYQLRLGSVIKRVGYQQRKQQRMTEEKCPPSFYLLCPQGSEARQEVGDVAGADSTCFLSSAHPSLSSTATGTSSLACSAGRRGSENG